MEKMLQKLARQLDSLDEASLMALWSKYATMTARFEPTRRWEEACLVFSLIQAKRFKNQLFNYCWKQERQPDAGAAPGNAVEPQLPDFDLEPAPAPPEPRPCRILSFQPAENPGDDENGKGD